VQVPLYIHHLSCFQLTPNKHSLFFPSFLLNKFSITYCFLSLSLSYTPKVFFTFSPYSHLTKQHTPCLRHLEATTLLNRTKKSWTSLRMLPQTLTKFNKRFSQKFCLAMQTLNILKDMISMVTQTVTPSKNSCLLFHMKIFSLILTVSPMVTPLLSFAPNPFPSFSPGSSSYIQIILPVLYI